MVVQSPKHRTLMEPVAFLHRLVGIIPPPRRHLDATNGNAPPEASPAGLSSAPA
jgi:hypothetical protein